MNLLACSMMRQNIASGLPTHDVSQKMQFHRSAGPCLMRHNKTITPYFGQNFDNPNIFQQTSPDNCAPSKYSKENIEEKNLLKSCAIIQEEIELIKPDSMAIEKPICANEKTASPEPHMDISTSSSEEEMSCSDSEDSFIIFESNEDKGDCPMEVSFEDDDDFIVFETEGSQSDVGECPIREFIEDDSSSDEEDDEWEGETVVFCNSNTGRRNRQVSVAESEDSFITFGDQDPGESWEEEKKSDSGKKVTFAEGPELCKVHLMVKWSFAYKKARKGLWEQFGRDSERFRYRAYQFGATLNKFLQPEHRRKVYEERFKDRQD